MPRRDFEEALAETLREGERIEGEWGVSPWLHLWSSWRNSGCLQVLSGIGLILVVALNRVLTIDRGLALPAVDHLRWSMLVVVLLVAWGAYAGTSRWIATISARSLLTGSRWLRFKPTGGTWNVVGAVDLERCRWVWRNGVLTLWSTTERGAAENYLEVRGLRHAGELRAAFRRLVGPPAELPERDAFRRLLYVVHAGAVYVPCTPLALEPTWTQGTADTRALLAAALAEFPDPGPFDPSRWHLLHPASRGLLRALDDAGATRTPAPR